LIFTQCSSNFFYELINQLSFGIFIAKMWSHGFFMHLLDEDRYEAIEDGRVNEKFFEGV
jgi:hypothetical protein